MACARIAQTDGLHRAEAYGVSAALSHYLDGHTALIDLGVHHVELVHGSAIGVYESFIKCLVFRLVHRAVEIVLSPALSVAGFKESVSHIHAVGLYYGSRRVEEPEAAAVSLRNSLRQRLMSKRAGGYDRYGVVGYVRYLLGDIFDVRVAQYRVGHHSRKALAVDRKGSSGGNSAGIGASEQQRAEGTHLFLQESRRRVDAVRFERIGTHELAQLLAVMGGRELGRLGIEEANAHSSFRELKSRLAPRESGAYNIYIIIVYH